MINSTDIQLVIFDWDGTLCNSINTIVESLHYTAQQYQQPLTDEQAKSVIGLALPSVISTLFPQVPELHQALFDTYVAHNVPHSAHDTWYDGALAMVENLRQQGFYTAIATGKARVGVDRVLTRLNALHLFDITRTPTESASKPNPLMLQQILDELGLTAKQAVMVGDSRFDLEMAQAIAMPRIGVSYGVEPAQVLQQYEPLAVVDSVADLQKVLLDLKG